MPSRMLWDKGVGVFVEVAKIIKSKNISVRFVLAGPYDPENPSSIPLKVLNDWNNEKIMSGGEIEKICHTYINNLI